MQQNTKEEKMSSAQICDQMCAILLLHAKSSNSPGQLLEVTIVRVGKDTRTSVW